MSKTAWRTHAAAVGLTVAFGSPTPSGRRLRVRVSGGRVLADRDESARWRGRVLVREEPAFFTDEQRTLVHGAAVRFAPTGADLDLELAFDGGDPVLIGAEAPISAWPMVAGVRLTATVTAAANYRGPVTGLAVPPDAACALALGQRLECAAGDVLATLIVEAPTRELALGKLRDQLIALRIDGPLTDAARLLAAVPRLAAGLATARDLDDLPAAPCAIEVLHPGLLTTVQDWPGRLGRWDVGVPPSGPFDDLAFRLANRLVGNPEGMAGLEMTLVGPQLRFHRAAIVCLTGSPRKALLDGAPFPLWTPVAVAAGSLLACGAPEATGCRGYLAIRHGLDVPTYLGSRATFDLGGFGGHAGRGLAAGDLVPLAREADPVELGACPPPLPAAARPVYTRTWTVGVLEGPHAAPEFFVPQDMATLYAHAWEVHHNSNRTGVRLVGPKPCWARSDGGEAGLHPSNIHDNAYAIGAIDFTGDMPILLGPDGPSCGGFVCPAVVVSAERWKLGQLRPGDTVRFKRIDASEAEDLAGQQRRLITDFVPSAKPAAQNRSPAAGAIIERHGDWCLRRAGDEYLLVEVGVAELDLALRLRIHLLWSRLRERKDPGIVDLTPGIRSLQLHLDPAKMTVVQAADLVLGLVDSLGSIDAVEVPKRTVWMPLSWDDPQTRKAIDIYTRSVNPDAPWCPSNIEFIRRINGLDSVDDVRRIVHDAEYLVMGLGDVYLGAPVATPLDPRHRLVTTKYNPARTWTPQNAVGIGGAYMCIYGMEGPGGYQFVGRTVPIWDTWGAEPCLLNFFDVIRFFPVSHEELTELRAKPYRPRIEEGVFRWSDYGRFLSANAASIAEFRTTQRAAFQAERKRWDESRKAAKP